MPMPRGICQRCGFEFKLSQLRKEWTGVKACYGAGTNDCWDAKNPQLSVRGVSDRQAVRGAAPEPADVFMYPDDTSSDNLTPLTYSDEADALFARMTTVPSRARRLAIDALIVALKTAGVWVKFDAFVVMAAHTEQAALLNWIEDAFNPTATNSPTFTIDRGHTTGTSSYLATGFNPTSAAGLFALDSAHLSLWSRTSGQSAGLDIGARTTSTSGQAAMGIRSASDTLTLRLNVDAAFGVLANTDGSGHFVGRRSASNALEAFRNNASLGTATTASTSIPNLEMFVGAVNTAGSATGAASREYAAYSIGSSLTDADVSAYYAALNTYMQAVGAA